MNADSDVLLNQLLKYHKKQKLEEGAIFPKRQPTLGKVLNEQAKHIISFVYMIDMLLDNSGYVTTVQKILHACI